MEQVKEKLLQIETAVDALVRDLVQIAPMIHESNQDTIKLNESLVKGLNRLQEIILEREIQRDKLLDALEPYFLTIEQYRNVGDNMDQIASDAFEKLNAIKFSLEHSIESIPKQTYVIQKHTLDFNSIPIILTLCLLATLITFGLGQLREKRGQLMQKHSYEIRYRLMALEMPRLVRDIDSLFYRDSERFEKVVVKREEEQRLLHSIERKRSEIKSLDRE